MNEQAGTTGGTGMNDEVDVADGTPMGAAEAAVIMREADETARRDLRVSHRVTFTIWGLGFLIGYGLIWVAVRGQQPFHGFNSVTFAVAALLSSASILAGVEESWTDTGVGGLSAWRRRLSFVSVLVGFAAVFTLEGALVHAGAGRTVVSVFEASAPILVAGLFYLTRGTMRLDWAFAALGLWLVVVAAVGGFAGPVGVWAVDALAAGLAYLLMAAVEPWLRRS
jgi:hypothetical protein